MDRMETKISVIIPTFNRASMVRRAVDSVLKQTFADFELIVVDDGSRDGSLEQLTNLPDPRLRCVRQEHQGVSAARNHGVHLAQADWIAFLDSDDAWHPKKLEKQWQFHQAHPELLISQTEDIWIRNGKRVNPHKKHAKKSGRIFVESLELCLISPSAVMMNKTLFESLGGFCEDLPACEDYDLWLRLTLNHAVGLISEGLVTRYAGHADQLSEQCKVLDRYRIKALEKILPSVNDLALQAKIREILGDKCTIISKGSLKRGRLLQWLQYYQKSKHYASRL